MKDHLLQRMQSLPADRRLNPAREYLQVFLLRQAHEAGALRELALVGGTALRLLHQLPRFSEDLDFSVCGAPRTGGFQLDPTELFRDLKGRLQAAGYDVGVKAKTARTVAHAFFRFNGIPSELGWTNDRRLGLSIKVEIDLHPPAGERVETTLIQRFFPVALRHYDLPSLFAGKLHAILTRPYTKGRDWYDLVWYLSAQRGLRPNEVLLNGSLAQTGHVLLEPGAWPQAVLGRLEQLDWGAVVADVAPFVEPGYDLDLASVELIQKLLGEIRRTSPRG